MSQLGDCQTDNQGNPLPNVGGTCNLAGLHLDASVIDTPDPSQIYGNGLVNNGMLDWEFYGVDARPSAGANQPHRMIFTATCTASLHSMEATTGLWATTTIKLP